MNEKLVIVGMGKIADEVRLFIEHYNLFEVIGYSVNSDYIKSDEYKGLPVYPLENLENYIDKSKVYTFVAASQFNYMHRVKRKLYNFLKENDYKIANLISPKAMVWTDNMGVGNWINDYAYIHYDTKIGNNNVFRPFSYVAHFAQIGDHNFMGVKSMIAGSSVMGDQCFVGVSATIINSVHIGNKCIIGAGTLIKKNVPDYCMCKIADNTVEAIQYTSETIENKLAPGKMNRKSYETKEAKNGQN